MNYPGRAVGKHFIETVKILKNLIGNKETLENSKANPNHSKVPTKTMEKEFFKLLIGQDKNRKKIITRYLNQVPLLSNSIVSGMQKGIDGFSTLTLAIRFYDLRTAIELVKFGANVNFIDASAVRKQNFPVFFDLLEIMRDLIERNDFQQVEDGFELWKLMESKGLNYQEKSIVTDGVNRSKNCLDWFISVASVKYRNYHLIDFETGTLRVRREVSKKEVYYEKILKLLLDKVSINEVRDLNANHYRSISGKARPIFIENGYVDPYILSLANSIILQKYGTEIENIRDLKHIKRLDKEITRFASTDYI